MNQTSCPQQGGKLFDSTFTEDIHYAYYVLSNEQSLVTHGPCSQRAYSLVGICI